MNEPYTISIHVMHGNPNGVRLVERPADWTGSAVVFPKEDFDAAKATKKLRALVFTSYGPPMFWVHQYMLGNLSRLIG
jgi:hypothetical protein